MTGKQAVIPGPPFPSFPGAAVSVIPGPRSGTRNLRLTTRTGRCPRAGIPDLASLVRNDGKQECPE